MKKKATTPVEANKPAKVKRADKDQSNLQIRGDADEMNKNEMQRQEKEKATAKKAR